jgi:hypothetical protein
MFAHSKSGIAYCYEGRLRFVVTNLGATAGRHPFKTWQLTVELAGACCNKALCIPSSQYSTEHQQMHSTDRNRLMVLLQADVALMPFIERFGWCLQLTQDYDMSSLLDGSVTSWLVSTV